MSLLARIQAAEGATPLVDKCAVQGCPEERVEGALVCGSGGRRHLDDLWAGRLRKLADGSFIGTAGPQPRQPEWLRRSLAQPHGLAKDLTAA